MSEGALISLLLSRQQVADLLACSVKSVIRLEDEGRLHPVRLLGIKGAVRYRRQEVLALAGLDGSSVPA